MNDDELEARLRAVVRRVDPVPALVEEGARAAFGWRTLEADLAELMRDSADEPAEAGVRSGGGARQLSFESPTLGIELEIVSTGPRVRRMEGQLLPPTEATVTLERPDGEPAVSAAVDELGRFVLDGLRAGAVRLHVLLRGAQVAVPWTSI